jgi:septum formation topological specificity factor MinE
VFARRYPDANHLAKMRLQRVLAAERKWEANVRAQIPKLKADL